MRTMTEPAPGWLPCDALDWPHAEHRWTYTDPATRTAVDAWCDGTTRGEEEVCGCGDLLCPCSPRPAGWSLHRAGAMNEEGRRG